MLWSAGATAQLPVSGLEAFAGYADNTKALSDLLLERPASMLERIEPETARNVELGVRYVRQRASFAATWYDIAFRNRIVFVDGRDVAGPDFLIGTEGAFVNAGGVESSGVELVAGVPADMLVGSLEWRGGRLRAGATHKVTGER